MQPVFAFLIENKTQYMGLQRDEILLPRGLGGEQSLTSLFLFSLEKSARNNFLILKAAVPDEYAKE